MTTLSDTQQNVILMPEYIVCYYDDIQHIHILMCVMEIDETKALATRTPTQK